MGRPRKSLSIYHWILRTKQDPDEKEVNNYFTRDHNGSITGAFCTMAQPYLPISDRDWIDFFSWRVSAFSMNPRRGPSSKTERCVRSLFPRAGRVRVGQLSKQLRPSYFYLEAEVSKKQ